jgi:all-trans-retinol dehydrogenase (NAD+)
MKSLTNKTVVVTGAASGIGRLMALYFAEEKAQLAIIDINEAQLGSVKSEIEALGVRAESFVCDISKRAQIEKTASQISKAFDQVDILVNNAGIAPGKWIIDTEYKEIEKTMAINLLGPMWLTKQFLPQMMERNDGQIVNISSAMGFQAMPRMSDYVASKFGLVGYSDTLRIEMKKQGYDGIKVTVVCPSGIDTGMFDGYKSPILSPLLKPEAVAKNIVAAVKNKDAYLMMPFSVRLLKLIKIFPADVADKIIQISGLFSSMDHLKR